jgi:hypothetical protein
MDYQVGNICIPVGLLGQVEDEAEDGLGYRFLSAQCFHAISVSCARQENPVLSIC